VFDRWHASLLGPTYPNRNYLHSAQSPGTKNNDLPTAMGGYPWETIWDRLGAANVPAGYYFTDLPNLALWGSRLASFQHPIDDYFDQAARGRLPNVVFVDPAFLSDNRTDDHPHADIRAGQRFLRDVFRAFVESPHWDRGLFVLTYDEWGGFYDHVAPPVLPDDSASTVDADNFGQAGFRVPTVMASPYARRGYVDTQQYDHTAVMRFLEWRFLGAPSRGPGADGDTWFLTARDRNAANVGESLVLEGSDADPGFDLDVPIDRPSPPCTEPEGPGTSVQVQSEVHSFEQAMLDGWFERVGHEVRPSAMAKEWASG
jgi:phospholipase C